MSISIVLYHNHYNKEHLEHVKKIMLKRGTPVIRCFYDNINGIWFAVEGCHRLRAAKALNLTPIVKDITNQKTLTYQHDGDNIKVKLSEEFFNKWYDSNYSNIIIDFDE